MTRSTVFLLACAPLALLSACSGAPKTDAQGFTIDPDFEKRLQEKLLDAKPGDVIDIPAGKYALSRSLSLTANGVTIKGAGMDKSILSFARQNSGAEGILVTGDDFTIQDVAIEDSKGDALKINGTKNAVMRRVRADSDRTTARSSETRCRAGRCRRCASPPARRPRSAPDRTSRWRPPVPARRPS